MSEALGDPRAAILAVFVVAILAGLAVTAVLIRHADATTLEQTDSA